MSPLERACAILVAFAACGFGSSPALAADRVPLELTTEYKRLKGTWCAQVTGSREPVRLRVRNLTPNVIRLPGGPEQVVQTSGGRRNKICLAAPRISRGEGRLTATILDPVDGGESSESPGTEGEPSSTSNPDAKPPRGELRRAWKLAREVYRRIRPVHVRFLERRAELRPRRSSSPTEPLFRTKQIEGLIARTEKDTLNALDGRELAALRDQTHQTFGEARQMLTSAGPPRSGHPAAPAAFFSSTPALPPLTLAAAAEARSVPKEETNRALALIDAFLARLTQRAGANDLTIELCFESEPRSEALILFRPQSKRRDAPREVHTDRCLVAIYRGLYWYQLSRRGKRTFTCPDPENPCAQLNTWDDESPVLHCKLEAGVGPNAIGDCLRLPEGRFGCARRDDRGRLTLCEKELR